ncbi:hypothetical protein WAI453_005650 [Rhynchosporium graminicola]
MHRLRIPRTPLEQIIEIFGLEQQEPRDVILVSLDLEVNKNRPSIDQWYAISQIGVSYFDTRCLLQPYPADHHHFATRHFIVGGQRRFDHIRKKYHFGISEHISSQDHVNDVLRNILLIPDEKTPGKFRDVILLAHGIASDLATCRKRILILADLANVVGLLDTTYLSMEVLGVYFSLRSLLSLLGLPVKEMHNAGNDANYTLRALLLLCRYDLHPSLKKSVQTLEYFRSIAFEPLPDTTSRNALWRSVKIRRADKTLEALNLGGLTFFDDI